MKKILFLLVSVIAITVSMIGVASASPMREYSDWAASGLDNANRKGLIPWNYYLNDYTACVKRGQTASLIMRAYDMVNNDSGDDPDYFVTSNYDNIERIKEIGIMKGKGDDDFASEDLLTREEFAVILISFKNAIDKTTVELPTELHSDFVDFDSVSDWAKPYVIKANELGLISGYEDNRFGPKDNVTFEMVIILLERCVDLDYKEVPVIKTPTWDGIVSSEQGFTIEFENAENPNVYIFERTNNGILGSNLYGDITNNTINVRSKSLDSRKVYYLFITSGGVSSDYVKIHTDAYALSPYAVVDYDNLEARVIWNRIPDVKSYEITVTECRHSYYRDGIIGPKDPVTYTVEWEDFVEFSVNRNREYKVNIKGGDYVEEFEFDVSGYFAEDFFTISDNYPQTKEEAQALQKTITVPVWKINKKGEKYSSKASITVHNMIADKVQQVFEEIYNGPEKFPIKDVGGFSWRGRRSEHNGGTAIDINSNENYCVYSNGTVVGSHWTPYVDPYSIKPYGDVVNAFENHGFTWGGDAWGSPKDYMHFSYLGT